MPYSRSHEAARRERETPDSILAIAIRKGYFSVSLRYRDDWLRKRCRKLKDKGLLTGGHRYGREIRYFPAATIKGVDLKTIGETL